MPRDFKAFSPPLRLRTTCHCLSLLVYTFTNNLVSLSSTKGWQKFGVPAWLYADVRKTQLSMHWNGALMFVAESMVCMTLSWKSCTRATSHRKCCDFARPCTWINSNAFSLFPAWTNLPIQRYVDQSEFTSLQQSTVRLRLILIYRVKSLTPCCHHPKNFHEKNYKKVVNYEK